MSIEYDGRKDAVALRYEQRDMKGVVMRSGVTGAKRDWALHPKFGHQNVMKRIKSAMGWRWNVKTEKAKGDGDIVRKLSNGSTLHIWIEEHAKPVSPDYVALMADRVSSGLMALDDVVPYAMETLDETTFDSLDWRDAVENELARREIGI